MRPLDYIERPATWCGQPTLQRWTDLILWELVLNDRPDLRGILELGTWQGGMSSYLQTQATRRGMRFATIDVEPPPRPPIGFVCFDLTAPTARSVVRSLLPKPGVLFCDNGDKPREVREFCRLLERGELLVVHDWDREIGDQDVEDLPITPAFEELWRHELAECWSAVFVRD